MAQLTPEDRARLETFKVATVKHAHLQKADDQLSLWVEEQTDATHVLLCGPGGVGKSKILNVEVASATFPMPQVSPKPTHPRVGQARKHLGMCGLKRQGAHQS